MLWRFSVYYNFIFFIRSNKLLKLLTIYTLNDRVYQKKYYYYQGDWMR